MLGRGGGDFMSRSYSKEVEEQICVLCYEREEIVTKGII